MEREGDRSGNIWPGWQLESSIKTKFNHCSGFQALDNIVFLCCISSLFSSKQRLLYYIFLSSILQANSKEWRLKVGLEERVSGSLKRSSIYVNAPNYRLCVDNVYAAALKSAFAMSSAWENVFRNIYRLCIEYSYINIGLVEGEDKACLRFTRRSCTGRMIMFSHHHIHLFSKALVRLV